MDLSGINLAAERAYPTPFANSPLLPLLLMTLATQRNAPKVTNTLQNEYDYIVVGAGSAGSVVAGRLSEEPCVSVLLLEAGHGAPLLNDIPIISGNFWFTDLDWAYKTVPQKNTGESLVNRQIVYPAGKGLGGSSLLNGMLYVRGNRKIYDDWANDGATGWSFQEVWPYFLKMEDNQDPAYLATGYHGRGGPLTVEKPKYTSQIKGPLAESALQLGYKIIDSSGARQTGFDDFQITTRNSQRCSTAKAYLVPAENRTNLDIVSNAFVKKVLFNGNKAIGVEFDRGMMTQQVKARREVIISAGATNSPQLLMLSGIGPKEHLAKFNIPLVADLPVGNNFQDHIAGYLPFTLSPRIPTVTEKITNKSNIYEYAFSRTGPLATTEFLSYLAFLNKDSKNPPVDIPDYELYFAEVPKELPQYVMKLKPEVYQHIFGPHESDPLMFCDSQLLHPKSRGTVRLQSNNPYDPPLIDPNYLDHAEDFDDIIAGLRTCKQIGESPPMQKVGLQPFNTTFPGCEKLMRDEYQYFKCLVKNAVVTLSHYAGTCKMGDPKDPTTVVDPQLRVKNVKGLRVIDASIMPKVTPGNTNVPTIMIAEKASDMIKQTIGCPNYLQPNYENFMTKPLPPMNGVAP